MSVETRTLLATCALSALSPDCPMSQHTWMLVLELCQVIDILIYYDVKAVSLVVRCHIGNGERLGHVEVVVEV